MNWLLLYYDYSLKKYRYIIFSDIENLHKYRVKLLNSGSVRTTYAYKLWGKHGGFI